MRESADAGILNVRPSGLVLLTLLLSLVRESSGQEAGIATYVGALSQQREAMAAVRVKAADHSFRVVPDNVVEAEGDSEYDVLVDFRTKSCRVAWTSGGTTTQNGGQTYSSQTEHIVTPHRFFRVSKTSQDPLWVSSRLLPSPTEWTEAATGFSIFAMFGYLRIDQRGGSLIHLLDDLRDAELTSEDVDGAACSVVSGAIEEGDLSVWFVPDHGNAVRRLVFHRTTENPDFLMDAYEYEVIAFQDVAGTFIPEEFRVRMEYPPYDQRQVSIEPGLSVTLSAVPRRVLVSEVSIESVEIALDCTESDFEPQTEVPNGTPVRMDDLSRLTPLRFEWRDGEVFSLPE